jgi:hypothetical protein
LGEKAKYLLVPCRTGVDQRDWRVYRALLSELDPQIMTRSDRDAKVKNPKALAVIREA